MRRTYRIKHGDEVIDEGTYDVTWEEVRSRRDQALAASDWRALKDVTLPNALKEYRQALRDLPQVHDDANDAVDNWPVMPDA